MGWGGWGLVRDNNYYDGRPSACHARARSGQAKFNINSAMRINNPPPTIRADVHSHNVVIVVRRFSSASTAHTNGYIYTSTHDGGAGRTSLILIPTRSHCVLEPRTRARAHIHFRLTLPRAWRASGSAPLARIRDLLRCVCRQTDRPAGDRL